VKLVLVRHGQSIWNREERFAGWTDVDLTGHGVEQAREAARMLRAAGIAPDVVYTSMLKRAIRTAWTMIEELDRVWVPVHSHWRLNERHYGGLEGQSWNEVIRARGTDWWDEWRRDYSLRPDPIAPDDPRHPRQDARYRHIPDELLRCGESVHDMMARIEPVWREEILPQLAGGRTVLVAVHGIAIRALDEMIRDGGGERMKEIANAAPVLYDWRGGVVDAASRRVLRPVGVVHVPGGGPDGSH
jgi:2,3-bisphosphoglycerate-dependent phosphoglycerate mutase